MRVSVMSLFALLFVLVSANAQKKGVINFQSPNFVNQSLEITSYYSDGKITNDTILIKTINHSVKYNIGKGLLIRVSFINKSKVTPRYFMPSLPIVTIGYNTAKEAFELLGINADLQSNQIFNYLDSLTRKLEALYFPFNQAQKNKNQKVIDSISTIFIAAKEARFNALLDQIKRFPNTSLTAYLLYDNFSLGISEDSLIYTFNKLGDLSKWSYFGNKIKNFVQAYSNIREGFIAPDFTLSNDQGEIFSLQSLRGKFVLIDFWASWCLPCRKKHPEMKEALQFLSTKSVEFLGISLDEDKSAWLKAIKSDGLPWQQLIAPEGFSSNVADKYGVKAIPFSLLIDPGGKIVKKNPSMSDLKFMFQ